MSKYAPQYFYFSESEVAKSVAENCAYAAANWHSACISAGGSLGDCYQGPREIANTLEKLEAASGKPTATTASTPTASYVRPQPQPTDAPNPQLDAGLANSISEAILSATPTAKINVAVENGHVTLTGTVDTTADREAAARIAELRPSVRVITNSLVVQATAQPPSDMPVTVDSGHESTVDRSDVKTSKELNAAGLRLLSARQSDFSEAKRTFEKAVQLDSSNIEALNNLGYVYSRIGDYRSAEATLLKVLAVAPTRRAAHGNLGYVEAKLGKTQEAVKHYCQYMQQFDSLERGKSALVRANAADPDPNVQAAIEATVANCTR
jgi:tetratricopeptide (TPR) repeat protein